jgi:MOSC domain-containing protein YiiM
MTARGVVAGLFVAPAARSPMQAREEVVVVPGRGIQGDRYAAGMGTFSAAAGSGRAVTLFESEVLEAVGAECGLVIGGVETRRNILTEGIGLNDLVGRHFAVGDVVLLGTRLAEPCAHLERLTRPGVRVALVHRGGLRADVVAGGVVRLGDPVFEMTVRSMYRSPEPPPELPADRGASVRP